MIGHLVKLKFKNYMMMQHDRIRFYQQHLTQQLCQSLSKEFESDFFDVFLCNCKQEHDNNIVINTEYQPNKTIESEIKGIYMVT